MSFLVPLALGLGALIVIPILAHALFRGPVRPLPFPAARFVPRTASTTQRRRRVEDRALLGVRVALLLALALLGSSPFVRCSRLSLARPEGASLAVALVIDDSGSMSVRDGGTTRLERALAGARQVLDSARADDAFSIVLAGRPARLLTPATTRLDTLREALASVEASDRSTDLPGALGLARASLERLPQPNRRTVVLSDFQLDAPLDAALLSGVSAPLGELRRPFSNCALSSGRVAGTRIGVELVCTENGGPVGRTLSVHLLDEDSRPGEELTRAPAQERVSTLSLPREPEPGARLVARLSSDAERDQLEADDVLELIRDEAAPAIAVRADAERAGTATGPTTVLELGLRALDPTLRVEPLSVLPESAGELARFAALIVDDPPGFTPETQEALRGFLEDDGVVLVLLGPRAGATPLASGWWPLSARAPEFLPTSSQGVAPGEGAELGAAWQTWTELGASRRARFEPNPGDRTLLTFDDGAPLLIEQHHGRGLAWVLTLPASVELSDLALRPAFLALLGRVLDEAALRRGSRQSTVGQSWRLASDVRVVGPRGPLRPARSDDGSTTLEPAWAGRYTLEYPGSRTTHRYVTRDPREGLQQPDAAPDAVAASAGAVAEAPTPLSRPVALLVLALVVAELVLRSLSRRIFQGSAKGSPGPGPSPIPPA